MVQIREVRALIGLAARRDIEPRDAMLLFALVGHTDTYSGRVRVTAVALAEELQTRDSEVRAGLARLKRHDMVRQIKDRNTGERYYRLNPYLFQTTKGPLLGLAIKEWQEA